MATRDLQALNLKFAQVMFNSLIFTWERNFEVTFGIFSVLVTQVNVLESYSNDLSHFLLLRLRNIKRHFKISFPSKNEAVKHALVKFKVQCLKVFCFHGHKSTILFFNSISRTTPEVSSKFYFVEIG